jgi:outer membrane receptor protein involved in Fe transport
VSHDGAHIVRRGSATSTTGIPEGSTILLQKRGENGRLPRVELFDLRLQKEFRLGKTPRLTVFADALNLFNNDAPEGVQSSIVTSSVYLYPLDPVDPRRFMVGAKFKF